MTLKPVEQSARRVGAQRPRIEHVPPHEWSSAEDAVAVMELAGKPLDEWQSYVLEGALGEREDGRWTAFEVGLICSRQNGKNVIIEARELAGLFVFKERVIIHSAHQFKTARKSFRDMERLIRTTPSLYSQVLGFRGQGPFEEIKGIRTNGSELSIELADGCKLEYQARSTGGGRGFTGDLIVLDEAYDLTMDEIAAMMPTMAARSMDGNPQIWYTSSAGLAKSYALSDLRERGMSGEASRLAYYEWSAPDDAESNDVDAWYQANPGLGIRISEEYVRETEFEAMDDEQFRRERMSIWAPLGGESVISKSAWARAADAGSPGGDRLAFAVDVTPARDMATIAAVSELADGRWHVQVVDRRVGTSWVPSAVRALVEKWRPVVVVVDEGSGAGALVPELRREGVRTTALNMRQYGLACASLFDAICQGRVVHPGQDDLNAAVEAAQKKPMGDSLWKWNRKSAVEDISPLVAVTHAWHGLSLKSRRVADEPLVGGRLIAGRRAVGRSAVSRGGGVVASSN